MSDRKIVIAATATFAVAFTVAYKRRTRKSYKTEAQAEIAKINLAMSRVTDRINAGEVHSISQLINEIQFEKIIAHQE